MNQPRAFKQISGVPASDDQIAAFAARKGIPSMQSATPVAVVKAEPVTEVVSEPMPKPAPITRFSIELPVYIADDIGLRAHKAKCSKRHIVMQALKSAGYDIRDEDMIPDGRRVR